MSDGQIIGAVAGGVIGFYTGGPGGALKGAAYGATIGGALDPPPGPDLVGPRIEDTQAQTSSYGAGITTLDGTVGFSGNVIWVENGQIKETREEEDVGGKGGSSQSSVTFKYSATFALLLTDHSVDAMARLWVTSELVANGLSDDIDTAMATGEIFPTFALQGDSGLLKPSLDMTPRPGTIRLYPGYDDQPQDPRMAADLGAARCPAYRGRAYLMFYDYPLEDVNNSLAGLQAKVELVRGSDNGAAVLLSTQTIPLPNSKDCFARYLTPETVIFTQHNSGETYRRWEVSPDSYLYSDILLPGADPTDGSAPNDYAAGVVDTPSFPEGNKHFGGDTFNYPSGRIVIRDEIHYGVHYGTDRFWRGLSYVEPGFQVMAIAVDDSGNIYGVGENTVKIYDEDLNEINSIAFNIPGPAYASNRVRVIWDNGFLYFCFGLNFINTIYIAPDDLSYVTGAISLPSAGASINNETQIDISNGIVTRFGTSNLADEAIVERYKLPSIGLNPPTLEEVVRRRIERSELIRPGDLDLTALSLDTVKGYATSGIHSIRSQISPLMSAYSFVLIPSGYQLKAVKLGGSPVMTIDYDDLDARSFGSSPGVSVPYDREMDSQLPRKLLINFIDEGRNYNKNSESSHERISSEAVNIEEYELPLVFSPDVAAGIAQTEFERRWLERYSFNNFILPQTYQALEAADVVTLTTPWATYELQIKEITYYADGRVGFSAKLSNAAIYTPNAKGGTRITGDTTIDFAGASVMNLLDIPLIRDADNVPGFGAGMSGKSSGWPGGVVFRSVDSGQTWKAIQGYTGEVVMGVCQDTLPEHSGSVIDRTNTLTIRFYSQSMSISSITEEQMMTGKNWFAYGADGRWEIGRLVNAVTNVDGTMTISTLARGLQGTEQYTGTHEIGDVFVFLSDADAAFMAANVSDIGVNRLYRGVTQGRSIASAADVNFIYNGINLKPLNPVNLSGSQSGNDWVFSCNRRSRLSNNWFVTGVSPPLGEVSGAYELDIVSGGSVVRTLTSITTEFTYLSSQQIEDFAANQQEVTIRVYQMSDVVGRGYAAEATFASGSILSANHPNLVAFYTMQDIVGTTLTDASANSNNGTLIGSPATIIGQVGNAIDFDGIDDEVDINGILPNDNMAFCVWLKLASIPSSDEVIVARGKSGETVGTNYHRLRLDGTTGDFHILTETGSGISHEYSLGDGPTYDDAWHLYIYNLDAGVVSIYEDDTLIIGPTSITVTDSTANDGSLGNNPSDSNARLTGGMDQVRIFDRPLTGAERTTLAGE